MASLRAIAKSNQWQFLSFLAINCFIVLYFSLCVPWLYCINLEDLNQQSALSTSLIKKLAPITGLTGLEQNWAFFSPKVRIDNHYNLAVVALQNGFLKLCELPRMEKLNILEKSQREKFRKLFDDNFPYHETGYIVPVFSRFLARANYSQYNPPSRIYYFLISDPLKPPASFSAKISPQESDLQPAIVNYFVYGISHDDFK